MSIDVKIREYKKEDIDDFLSLLAEQETGADSKERKDNDDWYREKILPSNTKYQHFVAEIDGKVIGYIGGEPYMDDERLDMMHILPENESTDTYYIGEIFVTASERMKGIGKKLIEAQIEYARKEGFLNLFMHVDKDNEQMQRICREIGMKESRVNEAYKFEMQL